MNDSQRFKIAELFERYSDGSITGEEFEKLESLLLEDKEARRFFTSLGFQHNEIRQISDRLVQKEIHGSVASTPQVIQLHWRTVAIAALAATLVATLVWLQATTPKPVAELLSSEFATWAESASPMHENA